ncbi:MAG: valine--tRNA ligase [Parcubacteria group bacterium]
MSAKSSQARVKVILPPAYSPADYEVKTYQLWEKAGYFRGVIDPSKKAYCIAMPPPNATGRLHLGHATAGTIEDILIRFERMRGKAAVFIPGTDHAALPTNALVEKKLAEEEGKTKHDLGREEYLKRVRAFVADSQKSIRDQIRRLGVSCDWSRERYTMDEQMTRAVNESFIRMYNDGLIYRGKRIISWCPRCASSLSDIEVEYEEVPGSLWFIKYPIVEDGEWSLNKSIMVATTRPETMLGDTAVAVNPDDKRYKKLVGKHVVLPLMEREIKIIADKHVDMHFGTGALKVTPAHDLADYDIATRHNLQAINVIGESGRMTKAAKEFTDLQIEDAREAVVARLQKLGFLDHIEETKHSTPACSRCDARVQLLISDQWFVKVAPLAEKAIEAVKNGSIDFTPRYFTKIYLDWMENLHDWNISRQIWWGHRIPVFTCTKCEHRIVASKAPAKCPKCRGDVKQDLDTLDTWFSSGLWTFATLGWPKKTKDLDFWHPTDVMETGRDLLFLWVARMVMLSLYLQREIPFKKVYMHGLVLDKDGQKMSKSKGNGIDPLDVADKYGMDAVRLSLVTGVSAGRDNRLCGKKIEGYRNTINKLWNVGRFVITTTKCERTCKRLVDIKLDSLGLEDQWILHRLDELTETVTRAIEGYRFSDASQALIDFIWSDFADWYLEIAKQQPGPAKNDVLLAVLEQVLTLLHPFAPFVTEVLWQELKKADPEIARRPDLIVASWPSSNKALRNPTAARTFGELRALVTALRAVRADYHIEPKKVVTVTLIKGTLPKSQTAMVEKLARIALTDGRTGKGVTRTAGSWKFVADVTAHADIKREHARVSKELAKLTQVLASLEKRLKNKTFVSKAPASVIVKERERQTELSKRVTELTNLVQELGQLR